MCDYNYKDGYPKIHDYNTFNSNDVTGRNLLVLITIVLILLFSNIYFMFKNKMINILIFSIISILTISIIDRPIRFIYIFSYILTSKIRTEAFLDKDHYFPKYKLFENNYKSIKKELNTLLKKTNKGKDIVFTKDTFDKKENAYIGKDVDAQNNRGWRIFHIKLTNHYNNEAIKIFPTLINILKKCPEIINCSVSILDEKTYIPIHNGYYKGMIRFMLPLIIPKNKDNVYLCNNYNKYVWNEGESVLWDDTYPHKVYNYTNEARVVLYMDIVRDIGGILGKMNTFLINQLSNSGMIKEEIEKTEKKYKL